MIAVELGPYREGFQAYRRMLAAVPPDARLPIFQRAIVEAGSYVARGLDRTIAADQLIDMAMTAGLTDTDAVQWLIAQHFQNIDPPDRVPDGIGADVASNGHDRQEQKQLPPPLLPLIDIRAWQGREPKPREWIVRERIPARNVTLLTGQGGVGKTLLMQQLAVATVLGRDWIGEVPEAGPVLFITAEDDENEMHFRFDQISKHPIYGATFDELADAGLNLLSLAGKDAAMAIADARGIVRPTELFNTMVRTVQALRPRWIGLDTAADIFVVNERDRSQVRQCISLLRGVALEFDTAVILLAHPSLAGISSGSGLSGSTAWNNSVRSRMYLKSDEKKKAGKGKDEDDDVDDAEPGAEPSTEPVTDKTARTLEFLKSNYSALAASIKLQWKNGMLLPDTMPSLTPIDRAALEQRARDIFRKLLAQYNKQDRVVSLKQTARNFAPKEFAGKEEAKPLSRNRRDRKDILRKAMDQLLDQGKIHTGTGPMSVPQSKRAECLYVAGTLL